MLFRPNQAYVTCPTAYLCDESAASNVSMCIDGNQVCDGKVDCLEGDDEVKCGRLQKLYKMHRLYDKCSKSLEMVSIRGPVKSYVCFLKGPYGP